MVADDGNNVYLPSDRKSPKKLCRAQGTTKALLDHQGYLGSHRVVPVGFELPQNFTKLYIYIHIYICSFVKFWGYPKPTGPTLWLPKQPWWSSSALVVPWARCNFFFGSSCQKEGRHYRHHQPPPGMVSGIIVLLTRVSTAMVGHIQPWRRQRHFTTWLCLPCPTSDVISDIWSADIFFLN